MSSIYATSSSSSEDTADVESKRHQKPLTKRTITRKLHELKIEKKDLKKKKKEAIADIEKNKKILLDMGYSNFIEMFEGVERLADDKDPRIRAYTLSFIEKLSNSIK